MSPTPGGEWPLIADANTPKQRRHNWIVQFGVRERKDRNCISFREIAEWVAEENRDPGLSYVAAYNKALLNLMDGFRAGTFSEGGKLHVLYLNPASDRPMVRMSETLYQILFYGRVLRSSGDLAMTRWSVEAFRDEHLPLCWIPRRMFSRWAAKRGLPRSPARFEAAQTPKPPTPAEPALPSIAKDEKAAVTELATQLAVAPQMTRGAAHNWCLEKSLRITSNGFRSRVWWKAREAAGLPGRAAPGRKKINQ
jgi:hypothetical protein